MEKHTFKMAPLGHYPNAHYCHIETQITQQDIKEWPIDLYLKSGWHIFRGGREASGPTKQFPAWHPCIATN